MNQPELCSPSANEVSEIPGSQKRRLMADVIGSLFFWRGVLPVLDAGLILFSVGIVAHQRLGHSAGQLIREGALPSFLIFMASLLIGAGVSGAYRKPNSLRSLNAAAEFILGVVIATLVAMFVI